MPKVNCSCSRVAPIEPPNFTLWSPSVIDRSAFTPMFVQRAILTDRRGRVVERIGAGRVGEMVLTNEAVRGEQRVRADHARVARRDVERVMFWCCVWAI